MREIFDDTTLEMLFDELEQDFDAWVSANPGYQSMTDQEIYGILPDAILAGLSDFGINASWMHHGM